MNWLRRLFAPSVRPCPPSPRRLRPTLQTLEGRLVPTASGIAAGISGGMSGSGAEKTSTAPSGWAGPARMNQRRATAPAAGATASGEGCDRRPCPVASQPCSSVEHSPASGHPALALRKRGFAESRRSRGRNPAPGSLAQVQGEKCTSAVLRVRVAPSNLLRWPFRHGGCVSPLGEGEQAALPKAAPPTPWNIGQVRARREKPSASRLDSSSGPQESPQKVK
jgi:hypothetical protein